MYLLCLDFETFFDTKGGYTLKKMTTEAYVRDPRFEVHGAAVRLPGVKAPCWREENALRELFSRLPWSEIALICHHAHFDGLILAHHFGIVPKLYIDTLSMARALIGNVVPKDLGSLADLFGLPSKSVPYSLFDGRHWHEIEPPSRSQIANGAVHDVELTWSIFERLAAKFPTSEYAIVDATVRMFTQPVLTGNLDKLATVEAKEADG